MKIIEQQHEIITPINRNEILQKIESIARVCYKSECKMCNGSATQMVKMLVNKNHMAMLEHHSITVKFICDRGISHEIVRHRIASYAQESTRYCNYSKQRFGNEITFIKPIF